MFKLLKYELRKNRAALLVLLAVLAAIEIYFLASVRAGSDDDVIISVTLMVFAFFALAAAVFVLGVSAYSGELKRKSSYLVFMTPHSTLAIVASKLLFTLAVGLLFAALATFLLIADMPVLTEYYGEWTGYYLLFDELLLQRGVSLSKIAMGVALTVTQLFLEVLSIVAVAYFSITLSATILQNRKARGLLSFLFFALIVFALTRISGLLWMETAFEGGATISFAQALAPSIVESALVLLAALFGSAAMLKRHVSL